MELLLKTNMEIQIKTPHLNLMASCEPIPNIFLQVIL